MSDIAERMASLESAFESFRSEVSKDNEYIKRRVDKIVGTLPLKVDRQYCEEKHAVLRDKLEEATKNGYKEELLKRVRALEQRTPAIIQQVVVAIMTAVLTVVAVKMWVP